MRPRCRTIAFRAAPSEHSAPKKFSDRKQALRVDKKIEIKIFNQRSLGPEPSTWTHTTKKTFTNHFDRRSEPLNEVDKEAELPLVELESTGVGFAWMFSGIGADEPTLVKAVVDAPVRSTVLGNAGAFVGAHVPMGWPGMMRSTRNPGSPRVLRQRCRFTCKNPGTIQKKRQN